MIAVDLDQPVVVAECAINAREYFRAEVRSIRGKDVVSVSRWKISEDGPTRTGSVFEFGAHRTSAISRMIADAEKFLLKKSASVE